MYFQVRHVSLYNCQQLQVTACTDLDRIHLRNAVKYCTDYTGVLSRVFNWHTCILIWKMIKSKIYYGSDKNLKHVRWQSLALTKLVSTANLAKIKPSGK